MTSSAAAPFGGRPTIVPITTALDDANRQLVPTWLLFATEVASAQQETRKSWGRPQTSESDLSYTHEYPPRRGRTANASECGKRRKRRERRERRERPYCRSVNHSGAVVNAHSRANAKTYSLSSTEERSGNTPTAMTSSCVAIGTTSLCAARCSPPPPSSNSTRRSDSRTRVSMSTVARCEPPTRKTTATPPTRTQSGRPWGRREIASTNRLTSESSVATIMIGSPDTVRPFRVPAAEQFATARVIEREIKSDGYCGHDDLAVSFDAV